MNDSKGSVSSQFARSALVLAMAMVLSQLIGLLSKSLIGSIYGASAEVDAFLASNRLTETLFNLVAGGALGSAFVPAFSALLDRGDNRDAWKLASNVANIICAILIFLCVLGFLFAPQIVRYILVPGFSLNDPTLQHLTVKLLRIQLPSVVIFGLSGLIMGILNANQHFLLPGLAPAMYQFGIMIGVLFLSKPLGIEGLAFGALCGSFMHFFVQLPQIIKLREKQFHFSFGWKDPKVRNVIRLMIPRQIGASAVQLNFLVNNYIASYMAAGSISALSWGLSLMLMPQAAIAQSVATVSLPLFSVQAARGDFSEMRSALASTLRLVLFLAIPASAGLIIFGDPVVRLIFERHAFTTEMTKMVSWALIWYGTGLVGHCIVEVVSRAFYAMQDTKTPVMILFCAMILNMGMSIGLASLFQSFGWQEHGGLALANSIATALEMTALLFFMRRKLHGLEGKRIWHAVIMNLIAAIIMGGIMRIWLSVARNLPLIAIVLAGVLVAIAVYGFVCWMMKLDEVYLIRRIFRKEKIIPDTRKS